MSLLDEIRADLVNESANLANTLRKAKILASNFDSQELRKWIDYELNGYFDRNGVPVRDEVPAYRVFPATNIGEFSGSFGRTTKQQLPSVTLSQDTAATRLFNDFTQNIVFFDGVGALEGLLIQGTASRGRSWPQEYVEQARERISMSGGMILIAVHQPMPDYIVSGLLDAIKNKLLDFVLGLQESNIPSEHLKISTAEQQVVRNLYEIHIQGDYNTVASGENIRQVVNPVQKGDIQSLLNYLQEHNVGKTDLNVLEDAISTEQIPQDGGYGPKVQKWFSEMVMKAVSGTWQIELEKATPVLVEALRNFYGT